MHCILAPHSDSSVPFASFSIVPTVAGVRSVLGVQSRQLAAESSLLLPCDVGTSVSPEQTQWFRDGVQLSSDVLRGVREPKCCSL